MATLEKKMADLERQLQEKPGIDRTIKILTDIIRYRPSAKECGKFSGHQ